MNDQNNFITSYQNICQRKEVGIQQINMEQFLQFCESTGAKVYENISVYR